MRASDGLFCCFTPHIFKMLIKLAQLGSYEYKEAVVIGIDSVLKPKTSFCTGELVSSEAVFGVCVYSSLKSQILPR